MRPVTRSAACTPGGISRWAASRCSPRPRSKKLLWSGARRDTLRGEVAALTARHTEAQVAQAAAEAAQAAAEAAQAKAEEAQKKAEEAAAKLEGIRCGYKATSCPDQLSKALKNCI